MCRHLQVSLTSVCKHEEVEREQAQLGIKNTLSSIFKSSTEKGDMVFARLGFYA